MLVQHPETQAARVQSGAALIITLSLVIVLTHGCSRECGPEQEAGEIVATVGAREITREELALRVRGELIEIENARYDVMERGLDELIDEVLLEQEAAARDLTADELFELEVANKVEALNESDPIGPEDVERFYEEYKERLGGQPLDPLRRIIEQHLREQRRELRRVEFLEGLRTKANVVVRLRPPKVEVAAEGPSRGPQDADVTIVEFSDFECPFCRSATETIEQLLEHYGEEVRLVFRHFPLPIHENAQRAAEAAVCANEGGKFWEYHDLLFLNQDALAQEDLIGYAKEVGLEEAAFVSCLESGKATTVVEKDVSDAESAGVSGTPSFFINGRPLSGALPYDTLRDAIDDELAWRNR